jgi:hypothetical protein
MTGLAPPHGRLRASLRAALPQVASGPPSPSLLLHPLLLLRRAGGVDRGGFSPKVARVGRSRGLRWRWLLIAVGTRGHVDGQDAAVMRGLRRDGTMAGLPGT